MIEKKIGIGGILLCLLFAINNQLAAQTNVNIEVINIPAEMEGQEYALIGTFNEWNNNLSKAVVTNNTLSLYFTNIELTPLDAGWKDIPEGANAAFSFVEPGTWTQHIVGTYGSNDNNFRVPLTEGINNTVVIDALYSTSAAPWLTIDIHQPSLSVNGIIQLPPLVFANLSISVINLPSKFEGKTISLQGNIIQEESDGLESTVENNTLNFGLSELSITSLGGAWTEKPLDANATFVFLDPDTGDKLIIGDYSGNEQYFRVRLANDFNNTVIIDASQFISDTPLTIAVEKAITVNGNLQVPNKSIDPTKFAWPGGKWKALIMSYDDAPKEDVSMVNLFNDNGIIGTFSFTSSFLNTDDFLTDSQVSDLFVGHEVANHSEHHPYLAQGDSISIYNQIKNCGDKLESLVGYPINGMAYPFGGEGTGAYDYRVIDIAKNLGIRYARTTNDTRSLEVPTNIPDGLMQWGATINDWDGNKYADQLINWEDGKMGLLYLWGHSHFLDADGWNNLTTICEKLGGRNDIWYAKNIEVADYLVATNSLYEENGVIYNPSAISVWMVTENGIEELRPSFITSVDQSNSPIKKKTINLEQNFPNPADLATTIIFNVSKNGMVNLSLFDLQGNKIETIIDEEMNGGSHEIKFISNRLTDGIYIYKLVTDSTQSSKLLVIEH